MLLLSLIAIANLALALAGNDQDTRVYYQDPSSTFGLVGVSSSNGDIYHYPGEGLVDQIIHIIDGSNGHGDGHGGGHHGHGDGHGGGHHGHGDGHGGGYPGQGGGYPGQGGGYPGQGGGYPGQGGGYPGQGGGYPGQGGGYPGQGGGYPGQGGGYPGQGGGYPGQGGGYPGQGGGYPGHGGHGGHYPNVRPGSCPPVRSYCPSFVYGESHLTCTRDSSCTNNYRDKCCYDRCLNEHVCKSPQHFGR